MSQGQVSGGWQNSINQCDIEQEMNEWMRIPHALQPHTNIADFPT